MAGAGDRSADVGCGAHRRKPHSWTLSRRASRTSMALLISVCLNWSSCRLLRKLRRRIWRGGGNPSFGSRSHRHSVMGVTLNSRQTSGSGTNSSGGACAMLSSVIQWFLVIHLDITPGNKTKSRTTDAIVALLCGQVDRANYFRSLLCRIDSCCRNRSSIWNCVFAVAPVARSRRRGRMFLCCAQCTRRHVRHLRPRIGLSRFRSAFS